MHHRVGVWQIIIHVFHEFMSGIIIIHAFMSIYEIPAVSQTLSLYKVLRRIKAYKFLIIPNFLTW